MDTLDMIGVVEAMQKRLLARVNFADTDYPAVVEGALEQEALESFAAELGQTQPDETLAWLIKRVAQLEARVNGLSRALYQMERAIDMRQAPPQPEAELDRSVIAMDENAVLDGFHYPERTDDGGFIRWIGPAPVARVYLPRVGLPVELTLFVASVYKGVEVAAVRVAFNDGPWTPVEIGSVGDATVLRCRPVPGADGGGLLHHIDIDCGATFSPSDEGGSDTRKLGIALSRIKVVGVR